MTNTSSATSATDTTPSSPHSSPPGVEGTRHYRRPGWFTRRVFNRAVQAAMRCGVSVWGARTLELPGRRSGQPRRTPVNLLTFEGQHYLVAARGHTEWTRNLRANDMRLVLLLGRRRETWTAVAVPDEEKSSILRAYLQRWKAEVGIFFDGVGPSSPNDELMRIAPDHPVFVLHPRDEGSE